MPKGPQPKHPDKRQRRNKPPPSLVVVDEPQSPPPPAGLKVPDVTVAAWDDYWSGSMARRIDIGDLPALYRLFRLRDEWEYNQRLLVKSTPLVKEGSQGQLIENPLSRINGRLAKEIRQMEDRFGMSPTARAQFAVAMGDLARTMDDLAKGVTRTDDADSDPLQIVDVQDTAE